VNASIHLAAHFFLVPYHAREQKKEARFGEVKQALFGFEEKLKLFGDSSVEPEGVDGDRPPGPE
jgi:hypothetical protein